MRHHIITLVVGIAIGLGFAQVWRGGSTDPLPEQEQGLAGSTTSGGMLTGLVDGKKATGDGAKPRFKSFEDLEAFFADAVASPARFDAYLEENAYSKESLLAAFRLEGDARHLLEAARRFPEDPHVQFLVITHDVLPDEKSEWVTRFKQSQPDNAYASLLLGADLLKQGRTEEALEQLRLAGRQPTLDDFSSADWLAGDSAMIDLGFTPFEAKVKSTFGQTVPFFSEFQGMLKELQGLANEAGDPAEIATIGAALGNQFTQGEGNSLIINRLVGISAEMRFLSMLEPDVQSPSFAETPATLLEQLDRERGEILELVNASERITNEFSQPEMEHYLDRVRADGELEALRWARARLGDPGAE